MSSQVAATRTEASPLSVVAEKKDLYEIGEIPPLGHVPKNMYAWAIRKERHGEPDTAMQIEVVPTWPLDSHDVLVLVMAAGVNYNGVWASLGKPISPIDVHKNPYHIAGSDASGIVWAVGSKVKRWKVGDEVVIHCNQDDGDDEECNGGDPMFSPSQRIWGYETPDGSFAQFCRVQDRQLLERPQPPHLGGKRLLHAGAGHRLPHAVRPSSARAAPRPQRAGVGRVGRPRLDGRCSSAPPPAPTPSASCPRTTSATSSCSSVPTASSTARTSTAGARCRRSARRSTTPGSRKRASSAPPSGRSPARATTSTSCSSIRAQSTFPVSVFVVKRGGMVVICAGTTGYNLTMDARYLWMHQKRVQGSHFANLMQASQANKLVVERRIDPCMSEVFPWEQIPKAHMRMLRNEHKPGNMAVLVSAPTTGLRTMEDVLEASAQMRKTR